MEAPAPGRQMPPAGEHAPVPVEQRAGELLLHLHVHHPVVVAGGGGETAVALAGPGHRRAVGVAVAQARQAVEQSVQQRVGPGIAIEQGGQATVDAPVQPVPLGGGEAGADRLDHRLLHQVAITQPQLVVVAQGQGPAAARHQLLGMGQALPQVAHLAPGQRREQLGGEHDVEGGVQLSLRQVGGRFAHGLDRLGQQQDVTAAGVHLPPHALEEGMGFGQPLAAAALLLEQEGHGIEPEAVHPPLQPEVHHAQHRRLHRRLGVATVVVAPHVEVAFGTAGGHPAGPLEPGVQRAGVVQHQIEDHADAAAVGLLDQLGQVIQAAQVGVDRREVGDVVAAIPQRRGVDGRQPDDIDPSHSR